MRRPSAPFSLFFLPPLLVLTTVLLSGCVNDAASYQINGREHALVLTRDQNWFWQKKVELAVVVSRLPDCQRKHKMHPAAIKSFKVELWQPGGGTYVLRQGNNLYLTETQTCEGFQELDKEPPGGLGRLLGTFRQVSGKLTFVPEPVPAAGAAEPSSAAASAKTPAETGIKADGKAGSR